MKPVKVLLRPDDDLFEHWMRLERRAGCADRLLERWPTLNHSGGGVTGTSIDKNS